MKIDGHIIDLNLLKEGDWVLDAGCRGFSLMRSLGLKYNFICLDPDKTITLPNDIALPDGLSITKLEPMDSVIIKEPTCMISFIPAALMPTSGTANYCGWSTGEGNYCYKDKAPHYAEIDYPVRAVSIPELLEKYPVDQFGLIKIDIEGGEYDLLLSIDRPVSRQICAEFHQVCGHNPYGTHQQYIDKLMASDFGQIYKINEFYEYEAIKDMYEYSFILR